MTEPIDLSALEFPRHVHLPSVPGDWKSRIVRTAKECEAALAEGYSLVPVIIGAASVEAPEPTPEPMPTVPVASTPVAPAMIPEPARMTDAERGFIRKVRK